MAEVRAQKQLGRNHFVLVDAGFNDLVRPAMYGSSHRMSVLTAEGETRSEAVQGSVVAGPLCESGDVFTQNANGDVVPVALPHSEIGDILVIHDAGAYGASMSSNYNSRPLAPEILVEAGHSTLIRRRQTIAELIALETDRPLVAKA